MDPIAMLSIVEKHAKLKEAAHVWTYTGYRTSEARGDYSVTIEVQYRPSDGDYRYFVVARDEHGREAMGNGASTLDVALMIGHWNEIDSVPPDRD